MFTFSHTRHEGASFIMQAPKMSRDFFLNSKLSDYRERWPREGEREKGSERYIILPAVSCSKKKKKKKKREDRIGKTPLPLR